ncbi:MAG TPA: hypothetical protein VFM68_03375 [Candidatus Saccharimonadales bacterium]|nr:hypothetical protein [Candidatus Saccharimonadales bacterium]
MPVQTIDRSFWALDFDRCLGNTEALYELFAAVLHEHNIISVDELRAIRRKVEATGGSFNVVSYLLDHHILDEQQLLVLEEEYVRRGRLQETLVQPGIHDLLAFLDKRPGTHYGIVTQGNPRWQLLKIKAAGLDNLHCSVVDSVHKAAKIAGWYDDTVHAYAIPAILTGGATESSVYAAEVVLVDDKPQAFTGIHQATRGYWVWPHVQQPLSGSVVAEQVRRVENLAAIVDTESVA